MSDTKRYNSRGNWWYPGAICDEPDCEHSLDDPKHHEYPSPDMTRRVKWCKGHYYSAMKTRTDGRAVHAVTTERKQHWKHRIAKDAGGVPGTPEWQSYLDRAEKQWPLTFWSRQTNSPEFANSCEEVTTVTKGRKRDQKVVTHIRGMYSICAVDDCDYPLYDVAHIHALKHGADDLPSNCIPLCPNHHRDMDRGRLLLADPADRSAVDPIEFVMNGEDGRILLDECHEVGSKYIEGCIEKIDEYLSKREGFE